MALPPLSRALRAEIVHYLADPAEAGRAARAHFPDGLLLMAEGRILACGPASALLPQLPADLPVEHLPGQLIMPGFIDTHLHYPQTDIVASHGETLLGWLERYTFPCEAAFGDPAHAAEVAGFFCDQLLAHGSTTAMVFASVHATSVDALFAAAHARRMRLIGGRVLMDRNCPARLCDDPLRADHETRALIARWHGRGRLRYALTPRFAPTSSPAQLAAVGRLFAEHPDLHLQTHLAETRDEVAWVASLHPEARSYLDVYARHGLLGERAVFAHGIWLDDTDRATLATSGSALAFCPSANLFLGSGLFDLARSRAQGLRVGLGSDIGAGTSFSLLRLLADAYKVLQLQGQSLDADTGFYLATLGGARSLALEHVLGNFMPGKEADFIVLDPGATPLLARRWARAGSLDERLFALMILGDDRAVASSWLMGERAWARPA